MKEIAEFRIMEEHASRLLGPSEGKRLGTSASALKIAGDDPRYERIGSLNRQLWKEHELFFAGWNIEHHYSR